MTLCRRIMPVLLLVLIAQGSLFAQASETPDADRFPLAFDVAPVLWGLDLGVGYRGLALIPGKDTIFWVYGGGAFEGRTFVRMPDGSLITGAAPAGVIPTEDIFYNRGSARWQLGIAQGFLWNPRVGSNLLEAFVFYRGRYDSNFQDDAGQLLFSSLIPDRYGIILNSVLAGVSWSDVLFDARNRTRSGVSAELTGEWGSPIFISTTEGFFNYIRFNLTARGFLPVFDAAPSARINLFSVYIGDFVSLDYALGSSVPLHIRQSFGGLDPRTGLGGALRGINSGSLDTNLKVVNNFEIRANLPALWIQDIVPGILVYWDMGAYAQVGEGAADPLYGFVTSVGGGVYLDVFDFAGLIGYVNYRLMGVNVDGSTLTFDFDFVLKF